MGSPIVKRYLIALDKYKWVGFATVIVGLGVSGVMAMQPTESPTYKAVGELGFVSAPINFSPLTPKANPEETSLNKFWSVRVIEEVAKKVNINPRRIQGAKIDPKKKQVSYQDTNREKAVATVQAIMEEMIEESRLRNSAGLRSLIEEVEKRMPQALKELQEAEQEFEELKKQQGAQLLNSRANALPAAIVRSEQQQRELQLRLEGVNAQINSIQGRLGLDADQAYVAQALAADPLIGQLRAQLFQVEAELERLLLDYREQYPPVQELRRQKQIIEQQLEQRAGEVLGGNGVAAPLQEVDRIRVDSSLDPARQQLASTLIGLETQQEELQRLLETSRRTERELRQEYLTIPNFELELDRLAKDFQFKKAVYDQMRDTLAKAELAEAEIISNLTVTGAAYANDVEVAEKNMALMLAVGGLGGIVVGAGLIFVLGMLSGKFYSWEEIKGALQGKDVPLLGVLPEVMVYDLAGEEMPLLLDRDSPYLESYEKLRVSVRRLGRKKPAKVLVLTSPGKNEGKSFSAYNMAIASARAGKRTLLIEGDLRSPSRVHSLGLEPDPYSAAEPLRYYGNLSDCIRLVPGVENLYVIPSPGPIRRPAAILESSEMQRLFAEVRHRFDLVVVDTPALSASNDAITLEPLADGIILVARPDYTVSGMLAEAIEQLTGSDEEEEESSKYDPRLLGAIINSADIPLAIEPELQQLGLPYQGNDSALESQEEDALPKIGSGVGR
ncbi:MAG: lipopolysaccharide biosynthesis [Cyanobacteriota bacterium]|nr:lipopolysaccharide biosynthesis [Cyanobacteriota bacterium]